MAKEDPQALCERLFATFLAPLVLGGAMQPSRPLGGKAALSIGEGRAPTDVDLLSRSQLARVRCARRITPIDRFDPAPTAAEWALAAVLHDIVQATHPGFDAVLRRSAPTRILDVVDLTLERIPMPASVGEALSRHSWLSRMFDLARTDTEVRWWTGSQTFLGTEPPRRLLAWPELRRVQQTQTPRPLMELPTSGSTVDATRFTSTILDFLRRTPLTDLATLNRPTPAFQWTAQNLALVATRGGRTLALRALSLLPSREVDAALGRATRVLFAATATRPLVVALDLLRDRALVAATSRITADRDPEPIVASNEQSDAAFAMSAGALVASHWIASTGGGFSEAERRALLIVLAPAASGAAAKELRGLLPP